MSANQTYNDYFAIDPKYYAAVTADLINSGKVKWNAFYPHDTFVKLLEKTHTMLSGKDLRSLWVEGAYGSGKSHAALTIKSLLEASDDEIRAYFNDFGIKGDLCQKLITDKQSGKLVTIHRIGSASIRSDRDLILAIQDSITAALRKHGIENKGEASLRDAALKWLEDKEANKTYFSSLIQEEKYMWQFGGQNVDQIIEVLKNCGDDATLSKLMRNIMEVAEDNGITALRIDVPAMCEWIKSILDNNDISAILFVWDEFTEYFQNNSNTLTGFQTLAEISLSHPFYFLIVTHESGNLIQDKDMRRKILDRFVSGGTVRIDMPENMAFRLMAQAMKETNDPVLLPEWHDYKETLNEDLSSVRSTIITTVKKTAKMGDKTIINDEELKGIVPIHPLAAWLLKHMSVVFNSNARSMFDFIISPPSEDTKGFKWFIQKYGPLDLSYNLLTIDMLWDFFNKSGRSDLNSEVQYILDSFNLMKKGTLTPDQERVFKTILLLDAVTKGTLSKTEMRSEGKWDLLYPTEANIELAFSGTDWSKGKARSLAQGLCKDGFIFETPGQNRVAQYTAANRGGGDDIEQLKKKIREDTKTFKLITDADLMLAVRLSANIQTRFVMKGTAVGQFTSDCSKFQSQSFRNRFKVIVTFALNDSEAESIRSSIIKNIAQPSNELFFVESLVPMGTDLFEEYVGNMAYSQYYAKSNKAQSNHYHSRANQNFTTWRDRISNGAFVIYTPENKSGIRVPNLHALQDELARINHNVYYYGLEQFSLIDNMFNKGPLAQGAECGITEDLKGTFKSSNIKTSLSEALKGAWKIPNYWEEPTKKSLSIVKIKQNANHIGTLVHENPAIVRDLERLFTNDMCRKEMLAYIEVYEDGILKKLASDIDDHGAYLDRVKKKFNADAANWVWSSSTADEKISDVILEYRIITESNKSMPKSISLRDVVVEWNKRSNYIKIPYDVLRKHVGDLSTLLEQLKYMKTSGELREQNKQRFYDALVTYRETFDRFYKDQLAVFKEAAASFLDELDDQDISAFFSNIPSGQFTKTSTEYYRYIENEVDEFKKKIKKTQLRNLWQSKTNTKDPSHWSDIHTTPILCMFSDGERAEAKSIFSIILAHSASDSDIEKAIKYIENASFYDRLNDPEEIDRCFMERIVGSYSVMLPDADQVRNQLEGSVADRPYYWMDNSTIQNKLRKLAEKQYKTGGNERVKAVIDKMDADALRRYLNELIEDNLTVGMEILKKQ